MATLESEPKEDDVDFKIELIPIAVADVDRSIDFYANRVGWPVDHDVTVTPTLRFVQVTPPGSACSFCFGVGLEMMPEGSSQLIQVVVDDADASLAYLRERGVQSPGWTSSPGGGSSGSPTPMATGGRCSRSFAPDHLSRFGQDEAAARIWATRVWPWRRACWSGVTPSRSAMPGSAPASSRARTICW